MRGQTQANSRCYLCIFTSSVTEILSVLKELQGSSLKLDFNVSTFAKEARCVPEASDIASRGIQKYDELTRQRSGENRGEQSAS